MHCNDHLFHHHCPHGTLIHHHLRQPGLPPWSVYRTFSRIRYFQENLLALSFQQKKKISQLSQVVTELFSFKVGHSILAFPKKNLYEGSASWDGGKDRAQAAAKMVTRTTRPESCKGLLWFLGQAIILGLAYTLPQPLFLLPNLFLKQYIFSSEDGLAQLPIL